MSVMDEVEDIMCDQSILYAENYDTKKSYLIIPTTKLWVAVDLISRAIIPSFINAYYVYVRNQQTVVDGFRRQLLPAVVAFLANSVSRSLASVQRISIPLTLRALRNEEISASEMDAHGVFAEPEKCVECEVLREPRDGNIEADVIFIHGLHGGLDKTWKQGSWRNDDHKLTNQFPIQRQYSQDFYVPPKPSSLKRTLSQYYSKIPNKIARKDYEICMERSEELNALEEEMSENEFYSKCWPKDWLPKDCPNVRVIALNYSTDVLWRPLWIRKRNRTDMVERSREMIEELIRIGVGKNPIVWVGHSKGGLFIKQIMVNAWEGRDNSQDMFDLFAHSKAIMFYSVPHKGSSLADFTLPLLSRSVELLEIQRNCNFVLNLHEKFLEIYEKTANKPEVFSFIETSFTLMSFLYLKIVAYDSADPNIGIKCDVPLDHREICKPAGRDCFLYLELVKLIKKAINMDEETKNASF
ncbi:unnamed protein product [Brassicogethes aeneus]|uniref:Protein SERAC1 n=1 Tax=Brassicogethes aeneus TaxID=1431903 RepID=A0A9P0BBN6_BRAAE|nr:unnamed protein product [Brassicogethes aeneus]